MALAAAFGVRPTPCGLGIAERVQTAECPRASGCKRRGARGRVPCGVGCLAGRPADHPVTHSRRNAPWHSLTFSKKHFRAATCRSFLGFAVRWPRVHFGAAATIWAVLPQTRARGKTAADARS